MGTASVCQTDRSQKNAGQTEMGPLLRQPFLGLSKWALLLPGPWLAFFPPPPLGRESLGRRQGVAGRDVAPRGALPCPLAL